MQWTGVTYLFHGQAPGPATDLRRSAIKYMLPTIRVLIVCFGFLSFTAKADDDVLSTVRDSRSNEVFDYKIDPNILAGVTRWKGPPEKVPLSVDSAIMKACETIQKQDIHVGPLKSVSLSLRTLPGDRELWAYSVRFDGPDEQDTQTKVFVVLLDGTVILPTKR